MKQPGLPKETTYTTRSISKTFTESKISSGTSRKKMSNYRAVGIFLYCDYASLGHILHSTVTAVLTQVSVMKLTSDKAPWTPYIASMIFRQSPPDELTRAEEMICRLTSDLNRKPTFQTHLFSTL